VRRILAHDVKARGAPSRSPTLSGRRWKTASIHAARNDGREHDVQAGPLHRAVSMIPATRRARKDE